MCQTRQHISLDVVIPIYNEEDVLAILIERLQSVFSPERLPAQGVKSVCYLFVDDGSSDDSAAILCRAIQDGLPATLLRLSRNFGHQSAVSVPASIAPAATSWR